jgi:hypothetical protein
MCFTELTATGTTRPRPEGARFGVKTSQESQAPWALTFTDVEVAPVDLSVVFTSGERTG